MKRSPLLYVFLFFSLNSAIAGDWIQKASFGGVARHRASGCATTNKGYMGLGHMNGTGINILYNYWWEYDPASMTSNKKYMTELSGIDLKVGGEGMKKYYDEIYPNYLNKLGKKYGAQVGETEIGLPQKTSSSWAYFRDWFAENHSDVGSSATALSNWEKGSNNKYVKEFEKFRKTPTQKETVRYLDITPEMRKAIKEGQPLASIEEELAKALA